MVRRATQGERGFTLVELLVVVAIIALLAAISVPSLHRARALARLTLCKSQLRNQAQAHGVYGATFGDYKPPLVRGGALSTRTDWASPDVKWSGRPVGQGILVAREHIPFEVLLCPSASMVRDAALDRAAWEHLASAGSSYVYYWRHPPAPGEPRDARSLVEGATYGYAATTGRKGLAMDINADPGHGYTGEYQGRAWTSHPVVGRINVLYIDGSARDYDNQDLVLRPPGGALQELLWWEQAHRRD